jgi:hypothetical protein
MEDPFKKPYVHNSGLALTSPRTSDASLPICGRTDFTFFLNCKLTILPSFSTVSLQLSAYTFFARTRRHHLNNTNIVTPSSQCDR